MGYFFFWSLWLKRIAVIVKLCISKNRNLLNIYRNTADDNKSTINGIDLDE